MKKNKNFEILNDLEAARARKEELLEKINEYNIALFNNTDLPYTDEEMEKFQEEYQILDDYLKLSDKERLAKLDDKDKEVLEDGTVVEKITIFDKIHFSIIIYGFVVLLLTCGLFPGLYATINSQEYIVEQFYKAYLGGLSQYGDFANCTFGFGANYWVELFFNLLILPLIGVLISIIAFILFKIFKKHVDPINIKISMWIMIIAIVFMLASSLIIFFTQMYEDFTYCYTHQNDVYSQYFYLFEMRSYYGV